MSIRLKSKETLFQQLCNSLHFIQTTFHQWAVTINELKSQFTSTLKEINDDSVTLANYYKSTLNRLLNEKNSLHQTLKLTSSELTNLKELHMKEKTELQESLQGSDAIIAELKQSKSSQFLNNLF